MMGEKESWVICDPVCAAGDLMEFLLKGRTVQADGFTAHENLLEYLRTNGLTGAKKGCAEGECGACVVAIVSPNSSGSRFRAVNSSLVFLTSITGQEIYTVEGLAEGGGSQCGLSPMIDRGQIDGGFLQVAGC